MDIQVTERAGSQAARPRMAFIDNMRWTVIAMVVLMHACVTYSGVGSWYYVEQGSVSIVEKLVFFVYQMFAQAFFMGLLFFIAAVFTPGAYDRKGFGRFVADRLVRLGAPTLLYMLVLHPLTVIIREAGLGRRLDLPGIARWYGQFVASGTFLSESGPLWFAFALLVFSLLYALARLAASRLRPARPASAPRVLTARAINVGAGVLIAAIALGSFFVRLVQPIGASQLNMQLCFFTQYVALFGLGLWAARSGFVPSLPRRVGILWLRLAFAIGVPAWFLLLGVGGALSGNEGLFVGGLHWQAAGLAAWEAFFCVSVSIGLLTVYRERANTRGRLSALLSNTSFGIYVFHAPVLVGVTMIMRAFTTIPLAKAAIAACAAWLVTLGIAWAIRQVPGLRRLFA